MQPRKPARLSKNGRDGQGWPEPHRFFWIMLTPDRSALACKLDDGQLYELPLQVFAEHADWDGSAPENVRLIDHGAAAVVRFASGAEEDFAVDWVLHHCEPRYRFFRGHCPKSAIGPRIRALRQARRLSLEELASHTGIAAPNLSRLENGKHVPSWGTLEKLAASFDVPLGELLAAERQGAKTPAACSKRSRTSAVHDAELSSPLHCHEHPANLAAQFQGQ